MATKGAHLRTRLGVVFAALSLGACWDLASHVPAVTAATRMQTPPLIDGEYCALDRETLERRVDECLTLEWFLGGYTVQTSEGPVTVEVAQLTRGFTLFQYEDENAAQGEPRYEFFLVRTMPEIGFLVITMDLEPDVLARIAERRGVALSDGDWPIVAGEPEAILAFLRNVQSRQLDELLRTLGAGGAHPEIEAIYAHEGSKDAFERLSEGLVRSMTLE